MPSKRYFDNPFEDYSEVNTVLEVGSTQLKSSIKSRLLEAAKALLQVIEKNLRNVETNDYAIYTGRAGYGLLYWHLSHVLSDRTMLDKSLAIIDPIVKRLRLRRSDISFILGDTGVLCIGSVVHQLIGDPNGSNKMLTSLKTAVRPATDVDSDIPDELLYGRSGLLYSLLFVRKYLPNSDQIIDDNDIRSVIEAILKSGRKTAQKDRSSNRCPLMFYWYRTPYVGAAHGIIGIMALLLEAKNYLTAEELNQLVRPTVDFLLSIRLPSGNFPSGLDDFSDELIHWCHGCPGAVHLFCLAFQTFNDEKYLSAAKDCCECIWKRGLLKKGYGLCHGTAGNGYAFLRLFQLTKDPKLVYRAVKFGEWCAQYGEHGCRTPDTPFSMFEGMAGTVYYLTDLLDPMNSRFPAYQLS